MTSQVALLIVDTGIGVHASVDVCAVAACNVGDVSGVVSVVGGTLFPSPSSGMTCPQASLLSAGSQKTTDVTGSSDNDGRGIAPPSCFGSVTPI